MVGVRCTVGGGEWKLVQISVVLFLKLVAGVGSVGPYLRGVGSIPLGFLYRMVGKTFFPCTSA